MSSSEIETETADTIVTAGSAESGVAAGSAGSSVAAEADRRATIAGDAVNVVRGFLMGAADTVPGVSGGTVALILGHYQRLVTAISHVDLHLLRLVRTGRLRAAVQYVDLRFMIALGTGIALGIVCFAGLMHWLLDKRMPETLAVFLGLVLASIWIVRRYVERWDAPHVISAIAGAVVAVIICFLPIAQGSMSLPFLFLSASIAICAMILPGISGAFVLLLLGVYHPVTGLVKDAARGVVSVESLLQIGVFVAGCGFGLLAFSRLLRWMLEHHGGVTMAGLVGLMVGSVARLWPMQLPTPETAHLEMKLREMEYLTPAEWPGSVMMLVVLVVVAALAVMFIERVAESKA